MRTILIITAGRQRYMEKLIPLIIEQKNEFNELQIWENSRHYSDKMYLHTLASKYDWIKLCLKPNNRKLTNIGLSSFNLFYDYILEPNCIYIKFDDDIVYIEKELIKKVKFFRLNNPEPPIIYVNTINNGICAHLQQNNGNNLLDDFPELELKANNKLWYSPTLAYNIQSKFRKDLNNGEEHKWYVKSKPITGRFSINCISWTSDSIPNMKDCETYEDEEWLTVDLPKILNKDNIIFGETVCQHFAYFPQRNILNEFCLDSKLHELTK